MSNVLNRFSVGFNETKSSIPVVLENGGGNNGGSSADGDYEHLKQKPRINGIELIKNKTGADLGLADITTINSILSMIAGVEQSTTATRDYITQDLVIIGTDLYEITTAVARGTQIEVGTNCKITTISGQLSRSSGGTAILG